MTKSVDSVLDYLSHATNFTRACLFSPASKYEKFTCVCRQLARENKQEEGDKNALYF